MPFLLIRYRDNGYLDASRHGRRELRVFSPDCCREPHALDEPAWAVSGKEPDVQLAGSYQRLDSNVIILKVKKATLTVAFLTEWWRRRESNPRPQALRPPLYMRSTRL